MKVILAILLFVVLQIGGCSAYMFGCAQIIGVLQCTEGGINIHPLYAMGLGLIAAVIGTLIFWKFTRFKSR